jgi:dephospho-CoA kinase
MRVVAVTGGCASGKSLVLHMFMDFGAYGIDCDLLSREVVLPSSKAWWKILEVFGNDIVGKDLEIKRRKLRDIIVKDPNKRTILEGIIHPEVRRKYTERVEAIKRLEHDSNALVVVDVPLLIEVGIQNEFDTVIVVYISEETQIKRVMARDGITKGEAKKLIGLQVPLTEKLKFADYIITNEGVREETENQVRKIFEELSS